MDWTDTALVLQVGKFREADLWVRLLAQEQGLTTTFAFGGSRSRRRFTGCLDIFNLILTSASSSKNGSFYNLREATLLEGPDRLRRDWQRQGMAANCIRFVEALGVPAENAASSFALTRGMLAWLEQAEEIPVFAPLLFRFRLTVEQGYAPQLDCCRNCGKKLENMSQVSFYIAEGVSLCAACAAKAEGSLQASVKIALSAETLDVLTKVQEYSPEEWTKLTLEPEQWRQAGRLIDAFIQYHLGLEWRNGRFRR